MSDADRSVPNDYDYDDDDGYGECFWCGGEGYVEALEQETDSWNWGPDDIVRCRSCGGSGKAEDMTIW